MGKPIESPEKETHPRARFSEQESEAEVVQIRPYIKQSDPPLLEEEIRKYREGRTLVPKKSSFKARKPT